MTTMLEELDEVLGYEMDFEGPTARSSGARKATTALPLMARYRRVMKPKDVPYRYICSLQYYGRATGVLIGPRTVLTAGRAVHHDAGSLIDPSKMSVLPAYPALQIPDLAGVERFIPCPKYAPYTRTDLALIHLKKSIGKNWGYWTEPIGLSIFDNAQPVIPLDSPTLSLAGYPSGKNKNHQYRLDNIDALGYSPFTPINGLITYLNRKLKIEGHIGSPVWGVHPKTKERIMVAIHIGRAPTDTAYRAVALDDKIVKFIIANTK
jgi:hypothetical protein